MNDVANPTETEPQTEQETKQPDATESRKALVKNVTDWVREEREFWEPMFDRMRKNISFAGGDQWDEGISDSENYQVNIVQRQLNQSVAAIYAKNPTVTVERKMRMEHTVWDGTLEQLQRAKMEVETAAVAAVQAQQTGAEVPPPPAEATKIVTDYAAGLQRKKLADRIAETLQRLITFEMDEQKPDFNGQMKSLVLREKVCGAAFLAVKFQRETETVPNTSQNQAGVIEKMQAIQAKARELQGKYETPAEYSACAEELQLMIASLEKQLQGEDAKVLREGIVYDFKPTTSILVDRACRCLHEFVGAPRIAELFYLTPTQVEEQWQKNVRVDGVIRYTEAGEELTPRPKRKGKKGGEANTGEWPDKARCCVAIVYDKTKQLKYVVCDGYEDFLEEPEAPWPPVKGFWPIITLKLKRVEVECNKPTEGLTIYGQSDVDLLRPMQQELNRSQQAKREHRIGNRPGYLFKDGMIDKNEASRIGTMGANTGIGLKNVPPDVDLRSVIVPKPTVTLDPSLYEKEGVLNDIFMTVGSQASNLGAQGANEKATGQAIAEQSRIQGVSSEVDEIDKFLTESLRITGEMSLQGQSLEAVKRKVGKGAAWPSTRREMQADGGQSQVATITIDDCLEQFVITIEAASSGRANQALDIANFKEMQPMLFAMAQALGLPIDPLLRHAAKIMDFKFDIEAWLASKVAMLPQPGVAQPGAAPAPSGPAKQVEPGVKSDPAGMQTKIANTAPA